MPTDRSRLRCAGSNCWFLVHKDPIFGGFCCRKCHWRWSTGSRTKNKHGHYCEKVDAPQDAVVAHPDTPDEVYDFAEGVRKPSSNEVQSELGLREPLDTLATLDFIDPLSSPGVGGRTRASEHLGKRARLADYVYETENDAKEAAGHRGDAGASRLGHCPASSSTSDRERRSRTSSMTVAPKAVSHFAAGTFGFLDEDVPFTFAEPSPAEMEPINVGGCTITLVKRGRLVGETYGGTSFKVYEAWRREAREEKPVLVLWLHGADMGDIDPKDLCQMQERLQRHVFFLVPLNPKIGRNGLKFQWACCFSKAQNKNDLGFVHGEMHAPFLDHLAKVILDVKAKVHASHVIAMGYSMGGFGVFQIAGHAPKVIDIAIGVAGYGMGTYANQANSAYGAPQPFASQVLEDFIGKYAKKMATVGKVFVVHARPDAVSHFKDSEAIARAVAEFGGCVEMLVVPEDKAESDKRRGRRAKLGHSYFSYTLLWPESDDFLYRHVREALKALRPDKGDVESVAHERRLPPSTRVRERSRSRGRR